MRLKPGLKRALLTLVGLVLLIFCLWIWIGIRIGIWTYPKYQRHIWLVETIPVAHALWSREVHAGDSAAELSRNWKPDDVDQFGPWIQMQWYPGGARTDVIQFIGIRIIAKNGHLVSASAYSDDGLNDKIFFNTRTTNDEAEFNAAYDAYVKRTVR